MATDRGSRARHPKERAAVPAGERQRIPLPPLPALRRGTRAGDEEAAPTLAAPKSPPPGLSREEADLLIGEAPDPRDSGRVPGPGHEGRPIPAADVPVGGRTGALGATILNDLVDQIEKDLEIEVERHAPAAGLPAYRRALACSFVPADDVPEEPAEPQDHGER